MTLKEILQARKRTASAPVEPQPSHSDNQPQVAVTEQSQDVATLAYWFIPEDYDTALF